MARKIHSEKFNKFCKVSGLVGASLMLAVTAGLIALLVLDIAGVNELVADGPRTYIVYFESEGQSISWTQYQRGDKITVPDNPRHSEEENWVYTFQGWDYTGDNVADILPKRAYYSFAALAVYSKKYIGPKIDPRTQEEPEETEEEPIEEENYLLGAFNG